ncbi:MAG: alpha-L-fucosidase [Lachnospiraceae bacterium]|nr:alpha-L-fucosidase [Lachnospiraceae bacterium]
MTNLEERLVQVVPSERQIKFQELEFYSFVHFTVNTYTGREWGDGTEDPSIFNPVKFDADQWVDAIDAAGMKGLIFTCKHHDGFCLWPSSYTEHTLANSPYKGGKGDIVAAVAEACKKRGIKFGVYLSPWDRNNESYGKGKEYDDYFVRQLTELLTNYGDVFSVWFDGACGEGRNGKKQSYDWGRYYQVIRDLQPGACINICGPDIRWCGNEAGDTRTSEWSVVPKRTKDTETIASNSQQAEDDDFDFRARKISASDQDLGSREMIKNEKDLIWYPAEVNTSIRPGWFYHEEEDDKVRSLEELLHIYFNSVGGNGTFLLNIPPTQEGLFHENDVKRLTEIGDFLKAAFMDSLIADAKLTVDTFKIGHDIEQVRVKGYDGYFTTDDGVTTCSIGIHFEEEKNVNYIVLQENIKCSQRVECFVVEVEKGGQYEEVFKGTVIGYKRIIVLSGVDTKGIRIRILDSRVAPTLSFVGVW